MGLLGQVKKWFAAGEETPAVSTKEIREEIASSADDFLLAYTTNVVLSADAFLAEIAGKVQTSTGETMADWENLYRKMRRTDPKVKSLFTTRMNGALVRPWTIIPVDESDEAVWTAELVRAALGEIGSLEGETDGFAADLRELASGIATGYAVSEVMWGEREVTLPSLRSATRKTIWAPVAIRKRRLGRFDFDVEGNLKYQKSAGMWVDTPARKFLVVSHDAENECPRGTAEVGEIFWWWYFCHLGVKWWMIALEKFGMPTVIGKYPPGTKEAEQQKLLLAAKRFQSEFGVVIPENVKLELLEAVRAGGNQDSYYLFQERAHTIMSEAILGQSLATGQGTTGTGSYAQAQVHEVVREDYAENDRRELAECVQPLVRWVVDLNVGVDTPAPRFGWEDDGEDIEARLKIDQGLHGMGLALSKREMYDAYGRSEPEDDEDALEGGGGLPVWGEGVKVEGLKGQRDQRDERDISGKREMGIGRSVEREGKRKGRELERLTVRAIEEGTRIFGELADYVRERGAQFERDGLTLGDLYDDMGDLAKTGMMDEPLRDALEMGKLNGWLLAAAHVQRWANEEGEKKTEGIHRGDAEARRGEAEEEKRLFAGLADIELLPPDEAIEWYTSLVPMTKDELERVAVEARSAAVTVSGVEDKAAIAAIQEKIGEYLREGKTLAEWQKEYPALRDALGLSAEKPWRAETLFRTDVARAYGAGRVRALRDPEIKNAFPAYQRVAVMDDRTRPEHAAMHGVTLPADDAFWMSHTPPDDYNCRCDLVPLTQGYMDEKGIEYTESVRLGEDEIDPHEIPSNPQWRGLGF